MLIQCPNCQKQYNIDPGKVNREVIKFRCQACEQVVSVNLQGAPTKPDPMPDGTADTRQATPGQPSATVTEGGHAADANSRQNSSSANNKSSSATPVSNTAAKPRARKKRLGVGGKMLLLFFLIPILLIMAAGGVYLWELKQLTDDITHESYDIVTRLSHDLVNDTARMVSEQCRLYLQSHTELERHHFNNDVKFRQLAMQTVGETGYTCIYAVPDGQGISALLVHPNEKIIGIDLPSAMKKALGNAFTAWYTIYQGAFSGKATSGYYDWKEKDGSMRQKYMTCVPVKNTPYIVAATTYVDEIIHEVEILRAKSNKMIQNTAIIILGVFVGTLMMIGISVLIYGRRLKGNLTRLTDAAERISVGELNTEININSNDEISDLADTITRMQESIRLSIERLRRRR